VRRCGAAAIAPPGRGLKKKRLMSPVCWLALFRHLPIGSPGSPVDRRRTRGGTADGFPDRRPDGPSRLQPEAPGSAPPRRLGLPPLRRWGAHRPPPPARLAGRRLPLQGLRPVLQPVHRHALAGDPQVPGDDPPDPARDRPRGAHRPARARAGAEPAAPAGTAAPDPGPRAGRRRPRPAAGRHHRGRRDVPERGGKKVSRTPTRATRPGAAATSAAGTAPGTPTGLRCRGWSAGGAAGSGCGWGGGAGRRSWSAPRWCPRPSRGRW
jgi:hypothetical protein